MSRANLGKDPDEVAAMFDGVARRYDIVNDLLSLGRTKAWRRAATQIIAPAPGMKILDLAAGPGSSSEPLHKAGATVFRRPKEIVVRSKVSASKGRSRASAFEKFR